MWPQSFLEKRELSWSAFIAQNRATEKKRKHLYEVLLNYLVWNTYSIQVAFDLFYSTSKEQKDRSLEEDKKKSVFGDNLQKFKENIDFYSVKP